MKKPLKSHFAQINPAFTLCGKAIDASTGSPLNSDGSVPADRVTNYPDRITCKTCLAAYDKEEELMK
jgi:hypothetical protein